MGTFWTATVNMEEADLFMECEEEELEPWQQMNTAEVDESSCANEGGLTVVENPHESKPVVISSNKVNTVPLLTSTLPATVPAGITKSSPGQQLILTQGAGGLQPVALSQVIIPGTSPGSSATSSQPIYITTQSIPVQNIQPGQSPLGIVLNVQQAQTVRPITLLQASGTPGIFNPAVGTTQIITQQAQMRPAAPAVNQTRAPGSYTAVQIPATLTIRSAMPTSQPSAKAVHSVRGSQHSAPPKAVPVNPHAKLVTVKPGDGKIDVQNLMSIVSLPTGGQPQTFVVMSNQTTNGTGPAALQTAVPLTQNSVLQVTPAVPSSYTCPRCRVQYKMVEALQGHMRFCCPDATVLTNVSSGAAVAKCHFIQSKTPSREIKNESTEVSQADSQSRIVMLVDEFYYGTFEGNRVFKPSDKLKEAMSFKCNTCSKKLKNNIRFMKHMKLHVDLTTQTREVDGSTSCPHCYRQFRTPFRLQCHVEGAHTLSESTSRCKICEWAFDSEPVFLQHMKNTHKPGEMPYVCQVCQYRSSFYSDVYKHFCTWHEDTCYLLCIYCLKVFRKPSVYQQHFSRHQRTKVYQCNKCRLQFLFTKDKVEHKVTQHKTFRRPSQLEGLRAGTKVTIRAYPGHQKIMGLSSNTSKDSQRPQRIMKTAEPGSSLHVALHQTEKPLPPQNNVKKQVSKMYDFLAKFQEHRLQFGRQKCVECMFDIPDFANHFPTYVHCSLCPYSTCCSRAYANHMINNHVPGRIPKIRAKKGSVSWLKLTCICCDYKTCQGDLMARHLVQFPSHSYCIFTKKECLETDIEFCRVEEEEEEEVEDPQVQGTSDIETKPDWLSMENWTVPSKGGSVAELTASSGPQHFLGKTSDVLDYFQLLFPDTLIEHIVRETNVYASHQQSLGRGDPAWHPLTSEEVKGFIGLSVLMGLHTLPEPKMYWSWAHYNNCSTFYRTMSARRFKQISSHIRMSSMLLEDSSFNVDKLTFFRPMLKMLGTSMQEAFKPQKCLTIDGALLPVQEKAAVDERPDPPQPKIWLLCDSKTGYCHKLLIQTQQEKHGDLGSLVVPYLIRGLEGKHHQIFMSSLLASVPLMKELHKQKIYCSSSIPTSSPVLPAAFWDQPALTNTGDFAQFEYRPVLVTRWRDAKEIVCLSTNAVAGQPDTVWRRSTVKAGELASISRPLAFKLLQDNMRGVDICNQLLACNQLGGLVLDTNWRRLFWFLVNLSIINSFIILRETRKGNPPAWLQGGHFSQSNYRKRLGLQLAKCAEKQALQQQIASDQLAHQKNKGERDLKTYEGVRHRLAKITFRTRRCHVCNLKNQRHESVYGCTVCLVNLCKRKSCFWDFHGFSTDFKGNPKIGFVEPKSDSVQLASGSSSPVCQQSSSTDTATSLEDSSGPDDDLDQEMAPLEASDSDLETDDDTQEGSFEMENRTKGFEPDANPSSPKASKEKEDALSVRQLRVLLFALCAGIPKAAKHMDTRPQLIKAWLRDKEKRLNHDCSGSSSCRGEAVERLVEWVFIQREQQQPISEKNLFQKASEISQTNQSSSFRISYEWAVSFMLQHKLGVHKVRTFSYQFPRSMEDKCLHFTRFAQKQIKIHNVPHSSIGAMDELSVFLDVDMLVNSGSTSKETAFQLEGTGEPWMNIYLSILADGTVLLPMMFLKGTVSENFTKGLRNSVLLETRVKGFLEKEELEIWTARVWQQHLNSQNGNKAILVIDGHHNHTSESFLSTMSGVKTLPIIVPSGCNSQRQPLEMCVRPVLQNFFLARWALLTSQGGTNEVQPEDLVVHIVTWLEEAIACFSNKPELIVKSFYTSHIITENGECEKGAYNRMELMRTLAEVLLGPDAIDSEVLSEEESSEETHIKEDLEEPMEESVTNEEVPQLKVGAEIAASQGKDQQTNENEQVLETTNQSSDKTSEVCSSLHPPTSPQSQAMPEILDKKEHFESCQTPDVTLKKDDESND